MFHNVSAWNKSLHDRKHYQVVQFEGSAVQPRSMASQSGPAKSASAMMKSDPGTLSHYCPQQDWSGTTENNR